MSDLIQRGKFSKSSNSNGLNLLKFTLLQNLNELSLTQKKVKLVQLLRPNLYEPNLTLPKLILSKLCSYPPISAPQLNIQMPKVEEILNPKVVRSYEFPKVKVEAVEILPESLVQSSQSVTTNHSTKNTTRRENLLFQMRWLNKNRTKFKLASSVLSQEFISRHGLGQNPDLLVYIQEGKDPKFDPEILQKLNQADSGDPQNFISPNIHVPCSRDFKVYYFLRSATQTRLFKLFNCGLCDFSIFSMSKYFDHLRTHTGERPYACGSCTMSFSQKGNLDKHVEMIHIGLAKFPCPHCKKMFTKKFNLQVHLRTILKKTPDDTKIQQFLNELETRKGQSNNGGKSNKIFSVEKEMQNDI